MGVLLSLVARIINRIHLAVPLVGWRLKRTHFVCHMCSSGGCVGLGNGNTPGESCLCRKCSWEGLHTDRCDGADGCSKGSSGVRKKELMAPFWLAAL